MPEYQFSRNFSRLQSSGGNSEVNSGGGVPCKSGHNNGSIFNYHGKVHTGYYQSYKGLSKEDLKSVIATGKKKGINFIQTTIKKDVLETNFQLSKLSSTLTEMKASITTFSGKPQSTNSSEANTGQEAPVSGDAGNSFGGRAPRNTKA